MVGARENAWGKRPALLRVAAALTLVSVLGCGRIYEPKTPVTVAGSSLSARLDQVRVSISPVKLGVSATSNGLDGTELRAGRIAHSSDAPCSAGIPFETLSVNGIAAVEGPTAVSGPRQLDFEFAGLALAERWREPVALDVEVQGPSGRSCVRLPLPTKADEADYRIQPTGAGFFVAAGARAYPALSTRIDGKKPGISFEERIGANFGEYRLWTGLAADPGSTGPSESFLVLAAGLDRALWEHARWTLWFGAGYDLVLDLQSSGTPRRASLEHLLQGPRVTPGISYALWRALPPVYAYPRPIVLRIALDAPTAVWFGSGSAPQATVVSAVTLGVSIDL